MQDQNQFQPQPVNPQPQFQPQPQPQPNPQPIPASPPISRPVSSSVYGGSGTYGTAPQSQPPAPQQPYSMGPPPSPNAGIPSNQTAKKPAKFNKAYLIFGAIGLIFLIGIFLTFSKSSKKSVTQNSAKAATIQLETFKDSISGLQFSYRGNWHFKTVPSSSPGGTVVYLAPNTITTDSNAEKHAGDPELVFYFYNTNPSPGHDTVPIALPLKKLGELTLKNNVVATVETQNTSHMHDHINNVVHVHDHAVTWNQFFNNLGWSLGINYIQTKDTLYQENGNNLLHVILNGQNLTDISQITNRVIGDRDKLLISFGNIADSELAGEYKDIPSTAIQHDNENDPATCSGPSVTTFHDRITHLF